MYRFSNAIFRLLKNLKVPRLGLVGPHAHQWGQSERAPGPAIRLVITLS